MDDISFSIVVALVFLVLVTVLSVKFKTFSKMLGAILSVTGIVVLVFGIVRANSMASQLTRVFGGSDDIMEICFVLGGIGTLYGIILLVIASSGNKTSVVNVRGPALDNTTVPVVKVRCSKCQTLNGELSKFCKDCGNLIITEKAEVNEI